MDESALNFTVHMEDIDRLVLLEETADELDALHAHLGGEPGGISETEGGRLLRALRGDVAKFEGFPIIYKIRDKDFLVRNLAVPFRYKKLTEEYKFYWLRLPVLLFPKRHWAFNRLELLLQLTAANSPPHAQPRAYQILPSKQIQTLLGAHSALEVMLNENLEFRARTGSFSANLGTAQITAGASVGVQVESDTGLVLGPFAYCLKKTVIDHTPTGLQSVFWRIDKGEFFEQDDLHLIVIVQLPKKIEELQITAVMQAYRYFSFAPAWLQQALEQTSEKKRNFFKKGAPIQDKVAWDLTPILQELDRVDRNEVRHNSPEQVTSFSHSVVKM